MATKAAHTRKAKSAPAAKHRTLKSRRLRATREGAPKKAKSSAPASARPSATSATAAWSSRDKKYAEIFGPSFPKGKLLLASGECIAAKAGASQGVCVAQYESRPDRMSWLYVTHGLSQATTDKLPRGTRVELALHWKHKDNEPARILTDIAQQVAATGEGISPGELIAIRTPVGPLTQWLVCPPDRSIPQFVEQPGGPVKLVLLVGVTDAEYQFAIKVRSDLADGRRVLYEALQAGCVYPVSDPNRTCLTRRRDFNRIWENAFRIVRESRSKA